MSFNRSSNFLEHLLVRSLENNESPNDLNSGNKAILTQEKVLSESQNNQPLDSHASIDDFYSFYIDVSKLKEDQIFKFDSVVEKSMFKVLCKEASYCIKHLCLSNSCYSIISGNNHEVFLKWLYSNFKIFGGLVSTFFDLNNEKLIAPIPKKFPVSFGNKRTEKGYFLKNHLKEEFTKPNGYKVKWNPKKLYPEKYHAYNLIDHIIGKDQGDPRRKALGVIMHECLYSHTNYEKHPYKDLHVDQDSYKKTLMYTNSALDSMRLRKGIYWNLKRGYEIVNNLYSELE